MRIRAVYFLSRIMSTFLPEDLLNYRSISAIDCVDTVDFAACAVKTPDPASDGYRSAIWLVPLKGGPPVQFTSGSGSDNYPRWSPDGSRLAFVSSRDEGSPQIYLMDRTGGEARALTHMKQGVVAMEWSPDSTRLLVTAPVNVDPAARGERGSTPTNGGPHVVWRLPYKSDGLGFVLDREIHLFVVDVATGSSTQITDAPFDVKSASWSPDGKRIAYTRTRTGREAHRTDVWVTGADGSSDAHALTDRIAMTQYPIWSPDGRWIVFTGGEKEGDSQQRLWKIDMASESLSPLGDESLEVESGDAVKWAADSTKVIFVRVHRGLKEIASISVADGTLSTLVGGERHVLKLARSRDRLVYASAAVDRPGEVYACELDGSSESRLTEFNPWWQDRPLPRVSLRQFEVPDGDGGTESIDGWLILPAQGNGPYPLLVDAHGGPQSVAFVEFDKHVYRHVLCSRGWAILALNPVGSSSYGPEFARRLRGRWGKLDFPQQLAAIDQLQRDGIADDRLAITGKSYGGFLSAWAISRCDRFRSAVVSAPVSNIESHFGTSDTGYYVTPYAINGEPFMKRDMARELCPMDCMHKAVTPTLILQGTDDQRCPIGQSEEMYATIMRSGDTPVEMVLYPGGDHHLAEQGKPSHRVDYVSRLIEWVERWTKRDQNADANDAAQAEQPRERERSAA
jgi:dipeptidyl aminopeptidase/acylaminoacyl peptidase